MWAPPAAKEFPPSPRPDSPWPPRQYVSYRKRPRLMDSDVRVRAFTRRSAVVREGITSPPLTGTVPGTGGIGRAYGLMLRWWRIVANQPMRCTTSSGLQETAARTAKAARAAGLRTAHFFRARAAQEALDLPVPRRLGRDEDAELVVREAGVVGDGAEAARGEQRVERDAEDGGERPEQHRHLEHDHDVGRDRPHRLAAEHEGPVVRHVEGDPGADRASRDA